MHSEVRENTSLQEQRGTVLSQLYTLLVQGTSNSEAFRLMPKVMRNALAESFIGSVFRGGRTIGDSAH